MLKIAPSLFACDFTKIGIEVRDMENAGADMLHIDVMDGHFVPNLSFGPSVVSKIRDITNIIFDVHLMISKPEKYLDNFAEAGADIITFHLESNCNIFRTIKLIKQQEKNVGIAIKPNTRAEHIFPYLDELDMVLVMTVEPGFGGQSFMNMSAKIKKIRNECKRRKLDMDIQVDGGINEETISIVTKAGANVIVSGSALFGHDDYTMALNSLREKAQV